MRRVLLSVLAATLWAQAPADIEASYDQADREIVRLRPGAFPELPRNLLAELERRGCTIPQLHYGQLPHNVIRGEFRRRGQTDWAVLCSVDRISSILVFWNGSERDPAALAEAPDANWLQGDVGGGLIFSRAISAVGKDYIDQHHALYGGPVPPPGDHQGINDAFVEKASVVHFYAQGTWHRLTGAD